MVHDSSTGVNGVSTSAAFRCPNSARRSVFADVCRTELVGRTVKMARKVLNDSEVSAPDRIGEITTLEILKHELS
jgi:hypothetical protein